MKRFYREVAVVGNTGNPGDSEDIGAGWQVALDGRPVRTPAQKPLAVPSRPLADAIAAEWSAQGERIKPDTMPLTQLANTALDRISARRAEIVAEIAGYAGTDLVCYRAEQPAGLVERQAERWQPLLDWLERRHAARLEISQAVLPLVQPAEALERVREAADAQDDFALAALHLATGASGSVVIALALAEGEIDADTAFEAAHCDELWQIESWGDDAEAAARRAAIREELRVARAFLELSRG